MPELSPLATSANTITYPQLEAVSNALWETDRYAGAAALFLDTYRRYEGPVTLHQPEPTTYNYGNDFPGRGRFIMGRPLTEAQVGRWLQGVAAEDGVPQELHMAWHGYEKAERDFLDRKIIAHVTLGEVTQERLAHMSLVKMHHLHGLHGALGKGLDVLNVAAGVVPADEIDPQATAVYGGFMSYSEFIQELEATTLISAYYKERLARRITDRTKQQLSCTRTQQQEVVWEGTMRTVDAEGIASIHYDQLALHSIRRLGDFFQEPKKVAPFLRQF